MRETISRRDTADTAIRVESLLDPSLHLQPFSPTSVAVTPGTEVDICTKKSNYEKYVIKTLY